MLSTFHSSSKKEMGFIEKQQPNQVERHQNVNSLAAQKCSKQLNQEVT